MATKKKKTAETELDARGRILAAAAEVFAEIGFAGARVDEIAERAGVNKAMLYYHVGDKEKLYSTILTETVDRVPPILRAAIAEKDTPAQKLQCVLETLSTLPQSNPHFVPIMLREIATGGATLPDEMLIRMAGIFGVVAEVLGEGVKKKDFRRTDPLLTHVTLIGSMIFLIASQPVRARMAKLVGVEHTHTYEDLARHTSDLVLKGLEK